jgi:hypothetical protein
VTICIVGAPAGVCDVDVLLAPAALGPFVVLKETGMGFTPQR